MRTRVRLERPVPLTAGLIAYEEVGVAWAQIVSRAAVDLRARTTLALRSRRDIAPGWRVRVDDHVLRVVACDARGDALELVCERDFT